jgi:hypothetical protein
MTRKHAMAIQLLAPCLLWGFSAAAADEHALRLGDRAQLTSGAAFVAKLDALPFIDNDYTRRFHFDSYDNPKLQELRRRYKLDEVVAPGRDEFERQILLLDWANHRFKRFGRPDSKARGALEILKAIDEGHTFFCAHYAEVLVSAAASLGWVDRSLALRRPDSMGQGAIEHSATEIWSNQYRKWVLLDPTFAMYIEKNGVPLNAYEIRQEWFYQDGRDLVFVLDKERRRYSKADLPVLRQRFAGFGDLKLDASAVHMLAFIGYIPNNNLLDSGPDYARMFIFKDRIGDGTPWHKRIAPADPAVDPYFPIHQAAVSLIPAGDRIRVRLRTLTPNFETYWVRFDGGQWQSTGDELAWKLRPGSNVLQAKAVNRFGVEGPVSTVEVEFTAKTSGARAP